MAKADGPCASRRRRIDRTRRSRVPTLRLDVPQHRDPLVGRAPSCTAAATRRLDARAATARSRQDPDGQESWPPAAGSAKQEHPYDRADLTGFNENWWVGLSLLHTLFAREHNAICDHLRRCTRSGADEDLFAHARLINAAVIAKIHVVEWTPAILDNPTVAIGMRGSWSGLLKEAGHLQVLWYLFSPRCTTGSGTRRPISTTPPTRSPKNSSPSIGCTRCSRTTSASAP